MEKEHSVLLRALPGYTEMRKKREGLTTNVIRVWSCMKYQSLHLLLLLLKPCIPTVDGKGKTARRGACCGTFSPQCVMPTAKKCLVVQQRLWQGRLFPHCSVCKIWTVVVTCWLFSCTRVIQRRCGFPYGQSSYLPHTCSTFGAISAILNTLVSTLLAARLFCCWAWYRVSLLALVPTRASHIFCLMSHRFSLTSPVIDLLLDQLPGLTTTWSPLLTGEATGRIPNPPPPPGFSSCLI